MAGSVRIAPPPPSLPHQGGGAARRVWHDAASFTAPHLPLDGGGWEGVTGLARIIRLLLVLAMLAFALPALAREEIRNFNADVVLTTDGTVSVTETIDVVAEGDEIQRGIYRDIPFVMLTPDGGKIRSSLDVTVVTRDGREEPFRLERMGNFQRIWIGDPDVFIGNGKHRYSITYTMTRMGRMFEDHDELYWNATGNYWIFPIVGSSATVTLPEGAVISNLVGYTGVVGSTEEAVTATRTSDNTATFRTQRALGAGEGMSFAVAFQQGILVGPSGVAALWQTLSDLREAILPVIGVLLVLAFNVLTWNRIGRDPKKGTIIPLFHPPKGFSPALTHYVHKWGFANSGWTAFTAAIFDLGVKRLVEIDNSGEALRVTATGKQPDEPLSPGEQVAFDYFSAKGEVSIDKANGTAIGTKKAEFISAIEKENGGVWFNTNLGYSILSFLLGALIMGALVLFDVLEPLWLVICVAGGGVTALLFTSAGRLYKGNIVSKIRLGVWVLIFGSNIIGFGLESLTQVSVNTAAVAVVSIVIITVVFAVLMRAPTVAGRKAMDEIEGFKLYLDTAEKNRLNMQAEPPLTIERFERMLPYAIALDVEKPWSEHFEAELSRNATLSDGNGSYSPGWYRGPRNSTGFSSGSITRAVSTAAASMTAAMVAAQPVQASSSGFSSSGGGGGGSSGGGGGGGGGGGW